MRLFDVLARQNLDRGGGGGVVDEVEEIYDFLNRENMSFFNLIERFRSMASLETRLESAQNQTTEAHRMLTQATSTCCSVFDGSFTSVHACRVFV